MENKKAYIFGGLLFAVITFFGYLIVADAGKKPPVDPNAPKLVSYDKNDLEKPRVEFLNNSVDWGTIDVKDLKEAEFEAKNVGTKPLQLFNMSSSCGCTAGQIIYQGTTSKEFTMHSNKTYEKEIAPGDSFKVKIIYRPWTMPVKGAVTRDVFFETNDPSVPKVTFSSKAVIK